MPFEKEFIVVQSECDLNNNMTMGAILRRAQQISTDHCAAHGILPETYAATHTAFLLAKVSVLLKRPIRVYERLRSATKTTDAYHAVYRRLTTLHTAEGESVAEIEAHWVLVDTLTRHILREAPPQLSFDFSEEVKQRHKMRLPLNIETEVWGRVTAAYSQTDMNRHFNNAAYADCICDAMPPAEMAATPLTHLLLHYHRELPYGETMTLRRGSCPGGGYYFCGDGDNGLVFEAFCSGGQ